MTPTQETIHQIDRLRRLAASVYVQLPPPSAARAEVEQFAREVGAGDELVAFWLAGESFVLMIEAAGPRRFDSTPFEYVRRDWFGYERDVEMRIGPRRGETVHARVAGTGAKRVISLASDGSGDELHLQLRDGPDGRAGQVVWHNHETGADTVVAQSLPELLRLSNDLVERDRTRAFFFGDETAKIFAFPGTAELTRQLDAGLSPDARRGTSTLVEKALDLRRDDLFHALVARGANKEDALVRACAQFRLDLAESLLAAGADRRPNPRRAHAARGVCAGRQASYRRAPGTLRCS